MKHIFKLYILLLLSAMVLNSFGQVGKTFDEIKDALNTLSIPKRIEYQNREFHDKKIEPDGRILYTFIHYPGDEGNVILFFENVKISGRVESICVRVSKEISATTVKKFRDKFDKSSDLEKIPNSFTGKDNEMWNNKISKLSYYILTNREDDGEIWYTLNTSLDIHRESK
ncbi:MAG: hypothetical protein LBS20_04385 [Prevotella sp.]|nr:hypothetical protein [Prevotella sp.]